MDVVDKMMQGGIDQGVFPGAVLQVVLDGGTRFRKAYGRADLFSGRAMAAESLFDLASLTKPLATVPAVMALVQQGKIELDQPCGAICPEVAGSDKSPITIRQFLTHSSGLPPWRPYFIRLRGLPPGKRLGALRELMMEEPLLFEPGMGSDYSDLGFMMLQWVVETVSGEPLDRFLAREVYEPLGIKDLFFNHTAHAPTDLDRYAATQLCPWRNRLMKGQVDDDNAFATGGVGGHAGLFGTADGVCRLLQVLLGAAKGDEGQGVFAPDLVRRFFESAADERWALGLDTPSKKDSSAGRYFAAGSIGHLGFTGTSFWMDPARGVMVVLLTNRVHPFRFNVGIKAFRPVLHDAVMEAL